MKKILFGLLFSVAAITLANGQNTAFTKDQAAAKKTVVDFYKWYGSNWKKMDAFKLYKGRKKKDQPPYTINWKEVERYFTYIRQHVPQLGEAFISNEKKFFKQCQVDFDANPEEEIAAGFDYDRFVGGQEDPELIIRETILDKKNTWEVVIDGNKATVFVTDRHLEGEASKGKVDLVKEKGSWKISKCIESVTE